MPNKWDVYWKEKGTISKDTQKTNKIALSKLLKLSTVCS